MEKKPHPTEKIPCPSQPLKNDVVTETWKSTYQTLSKLLLLMGVLYVVGFVALYNMQLARDQQMEQQQLTHDQQMERLQQELDDLRDRCVMKDTVQENPDHKVNLDLKMSATTENAQSDSKNSKVWPFQESRSTSVLSQLLNWNWSVKQHREILDVTSVRHRFRREVPRADPTPSPQVDTTNVTPSSTVTSSNVTTSHPAVVSSIDLPCLTTESPAFVSLFDLVKKLKKTMKRAQRSTAIHLYADINEEAMARMHPDDSRNKGRFKSGGFVLKNSVFNIWKTEDWSDKKLFRYNDGSGKVKIKESGIYLVYAQVMIHHRSARKSIALHIDDEIKPFVEYVSMERVIKRAKREHGGSNSTVAITEEYNENEATLMSLTRNTRDKRSTRDRRHNPIYTRASLVAVNKIEKDQVVFLKSTETNKGIIVKRYLTYWGIAKLNM